MGFSSDLDPFQLHIRSRCPADFWPRHLRIRRWEQLGLLCQRLFCSTKSMWDIRKVRWLCWEGPTLHSFGHLTEYQFQNSNYVKGIPLPDWAFALTTSKDLKTSQENERKKVGASGSKCRNHVIVRWCGWCFRSWRSLITTALDLQRQALQEAEEKSKSLRQAEARTHSVRPTGTYRLSALPVALPVWLCQEQRIKDKDQELKKLSHSPVRVKRFGVGCRNRRWMMSDALLGGFKCFWDDSPNWLFLLWWWACKPPLLRDDMCSHFSECRNE